MFRRALIVLAALLPGIAWAATNPNIVLITLDSTRADRMGFLGAKRPTPSLDALAKQSIVFERAYAQAPLTVVSHATILSGTYPQTAKVTEFGAALAPTVPYLPDLLHARGYHTGAFVGSIALDPGNGLAPGFDHGFDVYDAGLHPPQEGESRYHSVARRGAEVVARANAWLARQQAPFFLWVHLADPHAPYGGSYDQGIAAADAAVGKLVAGLRARKLYDDAVIIVTADHGESLGAHGEDTHGIFLYDETIRVPLLVKLPQNQMSAKRVAGRVRLVDVAPTALELAGVAVPPAMQGQSLLRIAKTNADQPVYSRSDFPQRGFGWSGLESWRAGRYLYIRAPKPELYDLTADPGATKNLAQTSKATLDTIAAQLDAFDQRFSGGKSGGPELTSSEMQKLASLGYVGLQKSGGAGTAATGTDPKDVIATANKVQAALLAIDGGEPDKAVSALQPLVAVQPGMYLAQYALGVGYASQQQYGKAVEHLHKAVELQPDSAWANYEMGAALLKTGDFKTAAVHLEIATSRLPECSEAHALLAQAYEHMGRSQDAKRERDKAGPSKSGSSKR
ncbi:MAG: sulfatase-like hydrolase/transferase [Acidobacteriia bacterium]|nr:sulfatase-like hydrolase/transferase [Terriglobia bacterium]